eukprot:6417350-Ditylum_brightwellii.AAC.1
MAQKKLPKEKGKCLCVCKKQDAHEVSNFLNKELQLLYQWVIPSSLCFNHILKPWCTSHRATKAVGSYADILTWLANPQDVPEPRIVHTTRKQSDASHNPMRASKRAAVALDLTTDTPSDTTTNKTNANHSSGSNTTDSPLSAPPICPHKQY